jgi:hypothetical protein
VALVTDGSSLDVDIFVKADIACVAGFKEGDIVQLMGVRYALSTLAL